MKKKFPLWTWKPIPPGNDNHSACAKKSVTLPHGFKIIAARVRGKKPKHEGRNCDDWFEIARSGEWGIIAVSDGASSKKLARVGARVACEAASNYLVTQLQAHKIASRQTWTLDTFARNQTTGQFTAQDIELTQNILHKAIQAAYHAIEKAYYARIHSQLCNHDLTLNDFAATLLLAVHTTVIYQATPYSLVLTCQVGDGMMAAVGKNNALTGLLGEIETNGFYGETQFLTSSGIKSAKTFPFFAPMQALMVMTDGVCDDYYPPAQGMLRLFGDLVLNGIVAVSPTLTTKKINGLNQKINEYRFFEDRITETGLCPTPICSVVEYAKTINLSIEDLVATPALLAAGIPPEILNSDSTPESRLQTWLDAYQIRGSFDDRTLVVLSQ